MPKPRKGEDPAAQRRRVAALYANGPAGIKGDLAAVNTALGTSFTADDAELRKAITAEGGVLPHAAQQIVIEQPHGIAEPAETQVVFSEMLTAADWKAKLPELLKTMDGIMAGTIKASAAQVSLIKEALKRALDTDKVEALLGVAIVPTLGCNENQQVCPRCGTELVQALLNGSPKD